MIAHHSRGFHSMHALDGLINYNTHADPTRVYMRPMLYTFNKDYMTEDQTLMDTKPAGIS